MNHQSHSAQGTSLGQLFGNSESVVAVRTVFLTLCLRGMSEQVVTTTKAAAPEVCHVGGSGLLLPREYEQTWDMAARTIIYIAFLLWLFIGVAIVADVFMGAIEAITSKKKRVKDRISGRWITVTVWNATVANLTLMALGSSAPEILLSVIEILTNDFYSGDLGPSTIVGSAAFNLLCIIAVCVFSIPDGELRKIKDTSVFAVTATFSVTAYLWLIVILQLFSPDIVEPWEGIVTFVQFPVLVLLAFGADKGLFSRQGDRDPASRIAARDMTKEELSQLMAKIRSQATKDLSDDKVLSIIEKQSATHTSRACYRVGATRAITGRKRVSLPAIASRLGSFVVTKADDTGDELPRSGVALLQFEQHKWAVLENAGRIVIKVRRTGVLDCTVTVQFKTRDGSAKAGEDYVQIEDEVTFLPNEIDKEIAISIVDDVAYEEDEEFFVDLSCPWCTDGSVAELGEIATAEITIIDDDEPGVLSFEQEVLHVNEGAQDKEINVEVVRKHGSTGVVGCKFFTENDSAISPLDFDATSGALTFQEGQSSASIPITIKACGRYERSELFRVVLEEPFGSAKFDSNTDGGQLSNICTVYIEPANDIKDSVDKVSKLLQVNWDKAKIGTSNWQEQFASAIWCNGSRDEQREASTGDLLLHYASLPWKLTFACIPPTDFAGGWLCFFVALIFIGGVTAVIGDVANLVGCTLGIPASVTAITFVALGTSLPDTFASKTAATQDPYADASVGNVTGSNSVNVFLGLGMPWAIGAVYWDQMGPTDTWREKYPSVAAKNPEGGFVVEAGSLGYSVTVFCTCALVCLFILFIRRRAFGGELGGPKIPKIVSSILLFCLWLVYIGLASWRFIEEKNAKDR